MSAVVNSPEFTDWLTMECMRLLTNKLFIAGGFNTDFASQYTKEFAVGATVRVPIPWRPIGGEGIDYDPEVVDRRHFDITVNRVPHVHFEVGAIEEALTFTRGKDKIREEILDPCMDTMKQKIETMAAQWAFIHCPNVVGALGTDPSSFTTVGQIRQTMVEMSGWTGKKILAISPAVNTSMVAAAQTPFAAGDQGKRSFVEGYLGQAQGFDWQESMSLVRHTAGTWQTPSAVTLNGAITEGLTAIPINCTSGDTFKAGDKIGFTGYYPVNPATRVQNRASVAANMYTASILEDVTATASTATITLTDAIRGPGSAYQNISALPANATVLVLWPGTTSPNGKSGICSVAINRDAFALCGVKLANPTAVEIASQNRDPKTGVAVAFVKAFDPIARKMVNRFDGLLGFGDFYARNCSVVLAGA